MTEEQKLVRVACLAAGCLAEWDCVGVFKPDWEYEWVLEPTEDQICPQCGSDDWGWMNVVEA